MERARAEKVMLMQQEEARRRIPKAPPPPPVVEMEEGTILMDYEDDEVENIVLDTGMHTVKVRAVSYFSSHQSLCLLFLYDRLA